MSKSFLITIIIVLFISVYLFINYVNWIHIVYDGNSAVFAKHGIQICHIEEGNGFYGYDYGEDDGVHCHWFWELSHDHSIRID